MNTSEKIRVMQAYVDGKPIEVCHNRLEEKPDWVFTTTPCWSWAYNDYRVVAVKPSINWNQVSKEFNYMAVDSNGITRLWRQKPCCINNRQWDSYDPPISANAFSSFISGTCAPEDSLVRRPYDR